MFNGFCQLQSEELYIFYCYVLLYICEVVPYIEHFVTKTLFLFERSKHTHCLLLEQKALKVKTIFLIYRLFTLVIC